MLAPEPARAAVVVTPEDVAGPPADAERTASGLASRVLVEGDGERPLAFDKVEVDYSGWTTDGKLFDSSVQRGKHASFPLQNVIAGWTEGLQLMRVGETRRFWIPVELAYRGAPGKPAGMLVFDVTLYSITRGPRPPPTPEDVAGPPAGTETDARGIANRVLVPPAEGARAATPASKVKLEFTCWEATGRILDSTAKRGAPLTLALDSGFMIAGTLAAMRQGESRRIWVPSEVAFGANPPPNAPKGFICFDVTLLEVLG